MENVIVALNVVLPSFIILAVGYTIKKLKLVTIDVINGYNKILTYVILPCLISSHFIGMDLKELWDGQIIFFGASVVLIETIVLLLLKKFIDKSKDTATSIIITTINSNTAILGSYMALSMYGVIPPVIGFASSIFATLTNALSIIVLQINLDNKFSLKTILAAFKNPIVAAVCIMFIIKSINIPISDFLSNAIITIGNATMGVSLLALGVFFNFETLNKTFFAILKSLFIRYIVATIAIIIAIKCSIVRERLAALVFAFFTPAAIATFPLSIEYKADVETSGDIVVASTAFSIFAIAIVVYFLKDFLL